MRVSSSSASRVCRPLGVMLWVLSCLLACLLAAAPAGKTRTALLVCLYSSGDMGKDRALSEYERIKDQLARDKR